MPRGFYKRIKGKSYGSSGYKHTFEDKQKMSLIAKEKGFGKWMSGKKFTQEHIDNRTKSQTGLKRSDEFKKLISTLHKGRILSEEHKKNISKSKKGQIPYNKGKKRPEISGEKSHFWKGGVTPINAKIRESLDSKLWKRNCLERDNWTCKKTGQVGGKLVVHHISNFSNNTELRFDVSNGITLSRESHREFHRKYGIKNNTKEQLEEFINN